MGACGMDGNHGAHLRMDCSKQNFGAHDLSTHVTPVIILCYIANRTLPM